MLKTREVNQKDPYASLQWGILEQTVTVGDIERKFITYIPDGARSATSVVLVLGENGRNAEELFEKSGWKQLADTDNSREKLILFFLEPAYGQWDIEEEYKKNSGDVAYVNAVLQQYVQLAHYSIHESKIYLYGVGEGGSIAHMAAMQMPAIFAGIVTVGAKKIPNSYLCACKDDYALNLYGLIDFDLHISRRNGDIPVPTWIIEDEGGATDTLNYWKNAHKTKAEPTQIADDTVEYSRIIDTEYPLNQDKKAYRIWHSNISGVRQNIDCHLINRIWYNFLSRHRRWQGDIAGDLRMAVDPVNDLGMEYHYELVGKWMREWYVYVPESVKKNPQKKLPLVFAMHGAACTGDIYTGNSEWYRVAQERNFILIHPSAVVGSIGIDEETKKKLYEANQEYATVGPANIGEEPKAPAIMPIPAWNIFNQIPNGPDECEFFREMLERTCHEYPVDTQRVYATGHSHGAMMTHFLAYIMPEIFAAAAPCSGVLFELVHDTLVNILKNKSKSDTPVPIWMFAGKREEWVIDAVPTRENATGKTIVLWRERNQLISEEIETFKNGWSVYRNRWHDLTYRNEKGEEMVRYTSIDDFPHATTPEMSYRIWDEFFAHWSREEDGIHYSL
ncbi:hypothetical protein LQZ18_00285 [Lachnospiraceae bacterium ZAX-1]